MGRQVAFSRGISWVLALRGGRFCLGHSDADNHSFSNQVLFDICLKGELGASDAADDGLDHNDQVVSRSDHASKSNVLKTAEAKKLILQLSKGLVETE